LTRSPVSRRATRRAALSRSGSGPPPHQHDTGDEFLYVASGTASIDIGTMHAEIGPGDYFHVPRATTHSIRATTDTTLVAGYASGGAEGPLFCDAAS
jgi:mannose-6-phosphate isomerase-like protein (cupin superfamily)